MAKARAAVAGIALGLALLSPINAAVPQIAQPAWKELPAGHQQILSPLAGEWDNLEPWRRKKWLGIAERYPSMSAKEQARIQRRMKDWAKLTPEERRAAREKYKKLKKAPPERREAVKQRWQEYKALPEEEKQRLKAQAGPRKPLRKAAGKTSTQPLPAPVPAPATPPATTTAEDCEEEASPQGPPAPPPAPAAE